MSNKSAMNLPTTRVRNYSSTTKPIFPSRNNTTKTVSIALLIIITLVQYVFHFQSETASTPDPTNDETLSNTIYNNAQSPPTKSLKSEITIHVHQFHPESKSQLNRMRAMILSTSEDQSHMDIKHHCLSPDEQRIFLQTHGKECYSSDGIDSNPVLERYDDFTTSQSQYAIELWKYCALAVHGGAYLDAESPLLETFSDLFHLKNNYAVLSSGYEEAIHGGLIFLNDAKSEVALGMVRVLVETSGRDLEWNPLLLPRALHGLIEEDENSGKDWLLMQQRCTVDVIPRTSEGGATSENWLESIRFTNDCPAQIGYCCEIVHPIKKTVIMVTRNALLPRQQLPPSDALSKPYLHHDHQASLSQEELLNLPFITTIREVVFEQTVEEVTPNFYHMLQNTDCLPSDKECSSCLRNKQGANCQTCAEQCECYCKALCNITPSEKFVTKHLIITPPKFRKEPDRLVPRIVHQTWFEPVNKEKYPNMSRLIESWKQSGWEYRFYDDNAASDFLSTNFPPEIRQAYDSLIPGAFKADLFRYCTLLINGGVYADMDVMLETNLDKAVAKDVGFMTPVDEPGIQVDRRMCLWNGFIASAPGHPFLAKVIETVVNNVRNRFTSVDIDNLLCPNPELSVSHAFDTLFTAGPCILGLSINEYLGRHPQSPFQPGDIIDSQKNSKKILPGRSIILRQNKVDMGAHRFTWEEHNLVVAATDMPDYDDRTKLEDNVHYSKTHVKYGVYGVENLYKNNNSTNEEIRLLFQEI